MLNLKMLNQSVQFSSVTQSCEILCDPVDWSTPGFPVHHQSLELTQAHVHCVDDAIQPSHLLSFSSHPQSFPVLASFQMSQFFTSGGLSIGLSASTSVLPINIQDWFPLVLKEMDFLDLLAVQGTLKSLLPHCSSKASILNDQLSLHSNSHIHIWLLEKP